MKTEENVTYGTDKYYWHRYIPEYERIVFSNLPQNPNILEIGVLAGESIKLLAGRFPEGTIWGADKLPQSDAWPRGKNIHYEYVNTDLESSVRTLFTNLHGNYLHLIIDDGSHIPLHQARALKEGLQYVKSRGFYIIEDVHSSFWDLKASPLVLLLALKHLREINQELNDTVVSRLVSNYFSFPEIYMINNQLSEITCIRRSELPLKCFKCGSTEFDYANLRCQCKESLYLPYDSMSLILRKF